ncbi:deleted in malignant brain tumors 1 protein-like isoform X3 [Liolophura sinensis]|uniref:deleted in malignant brain tumors 1 protein-like isoform X3 n=1 Tax=Liolophura sinensis TaxID=3198878 RepID=UPI00315948A5
MTVRCANLDRWTCVVAVMVTLLTAPVIGSTRTRLTKGNRALQLYSGRLEVFYNNKWGTVCDDKFNERTAGVICRTLGFSFGYFVTSRVFGAGSGQIWLDDVVCVGWETDISQCSHNAWGVHNCQHNEDVGLVCERIPGKYSGPPFRLSSGFGNKESLRGRLEVLYNNIWGTVCDDSFTLNTARVICSLLGFSSGYQVVNSRFGAGSGQIWLDDVVCSGGETDISQCSHNAWGVNNCHHNEDVGLVCFNTVETPLKLVNGFGNNESLTGRLEVFYNNIWGTVCDDSFTLNTARVICSLLGFSSGYQVVNSRFGAGSGQIWLDDVVCSGGETDISQCSHNAWGVNNCHHNEDVGLVCLNTLETPLKLVNGFGNNESLSGRLEVFYNNLWGTVCDDSFTPNTVRVICSLLGFSSGYQVVNSRFGAGSGQMWLDDVVCSGGETDISQCSHNAWGVNNCQHTEDVGLVCLNTPADISSPAMTTRIQDKTQTPTELLSTSTDISSPAMTTRIQDKTQTPTELLSTSNEHSTNTPVLCKIQTSDSNAESKGLDNRALIVGVAVGVGEAIIGIVIVVIVVIVRRCRHSQRGAHNESGARDEHFYENEVFVVQNRGRNRPCREVAPETERPQSASSVAHIYEQVVFR